MSEQGEPGPLPISDVLPGMKMMPLPESHEAETVYLLIKTRSTGGDGNSEFTWCWRSPEIVNHEELLGALVSQADLLRAQMLKWWED